MGPYGTELRIIEPKCYDIMRRVITIYSCSSTDCAKVTVHQNRLEYI